MHLDQRLSQVVAGGAMVVVVVEGGSQSDLVLFSGIFIDQTLFKSLELMSWLFCNFLRVCVLWSFYFL